MRGLQLIDLLTDGLGHIERRWLCLYLNCAKEGFYIYFQMGRKIESKGGEGERNIHVVYKLETYTICVYVRIH